MANRTKLFISHATPCDNEFAAWLAAKLELHGYSVWVDIHELDPATDFWNTIESTIRTKSAKFLFVATKESISDKRDGVKKELAVADKVKKTVSDFIVPLRADDVSFDDFPVEIVRQNAIDFYNDWATGLAKLLKYLEKQNAPKSTEQPSNMEEALNRWKEVKLSSNSGIVKQRDEYYSNLFPVALPQSLYVYSNPQIATLLYSKHIPFRKINNCVLTLFCPACVKTVLNVDTAIEEFDFPAIINSNSSIMPFEVEIKGINRICVDLLNQNIDRFFYQAELKEYKLNANKRSKNRYYFTFGTKSRRYEKSREKGLSGIYKITRRWHYGLSAYYTEFPFVGIQFNSHLIFADENGMLLPDSRQHSARRSKGKAFFNKEWRDMLQAAIYNLSKGTDKMVVKLCCKENEMTIDNEPYKFSTQYGYAEPETNPEETVEVFQDDEE